MEPGEVYELDGADDAGRAPLPAGAPAPPDDRLEQLPELPSERRRGRVAVPRDGGVVAENTVYHDAVQASDAAPACPWAMSAVPSTPARPLLAVSDLHTYFPTPARHGQGGRGRLVRDPSGEILGVVGESGCGKSITALSIVRLLQPPGRIVSGSVRFDGVELTALSDRELQRLRGDRIAMIFQDPMTALNPVFRVGWQVAEPMRAASQRVTRTRRRARRSRCSSGSGSRRPSSRARDYPHQFSGGMRQRAMIARRWSTAPALLIADEPTTALDVTVQAQILELIRAITAEYDTATMLITHNLGVVSGLCDRVLVMYAGRVVEEGPAEVVLTDPRHPYTRGLLRSLPRLDRRRQVRARRRSRAARPILRQAARAARSTALRLHGSTAAPRSSRPSRRIASGSSPRAGTPREAARSRERLGERQPLVEAQSLRVLFPVRRGTLQRVVANVHAVDGVDLRIEEGETVGLVGESGCGKSTLGRTRPAAHRADSRTRRCSAART